MKRKPRSARPMTSRANSNSRRSKLRAGPTSRGSQRSGLTLLEILLASAILAAALAALSQQNSNGVRAALRSQLETEAAVLCQSQLNRLVLNPNTSFNVRDQAFDHDPRWRWSSMVKPSSFPGLSLVTVTVYQDGVNQNMATFSLSRLVSIDQQRSNP